MENEQLSNSALTESRHLRGNCRRGWVAGGMGEGGREGGRQWPADYLLD